MIDQLTDEDLIYHLLDSGEDKYFNELIERYKDKIFNFVIRYLSSREDSEDITEDIFIKVYFKIDKFDKNKGSFKTWLFKIAKNTIYNKLKERKMVKISYDDIYSDKEDIDLNIENNEIIQNAINKLKKDQKTIILLYYMEGLKYREIAKTLNMPENTIKTKIRRAKEILKNELNEYF